MREQLEAALAGRYAVERELGRGGMASVWLGRDLRHERLVALKLLRPELAGAIGAERFLREVRLTSRLQHPHIITVFDSGVVPGPGGTTLPWYAMSYVAGEPLRARLTRERQLPVDEALRIARDVAAALDAAHRAGIVHRDVKPENILLAGGEAFVADFGIAKALLDTGGDRLTSTGFAIGTPAYMSPEQSAGDPVDARADQYGLACVLYEMLAGEPPYTGPTAQAIIARRMTAPPAPIRPVRPAVPAAVEAALQRALERIPADRFPDLPAFVAALAGKGDASTAPVPAVRWRSPPLRRLAVAVAVLLAVVGATLAVRRRAGPPHRPTEVVALVERGMREYAKRTPEGVAAAIGDFTAAVARDSGYADGWVGLALAYARALERGFEVPGVARDSLLRLALASGDRALEADPGRADVWVARGVVSRKVDPTDVGPAISALRRAVALDSTSVEAWHFLALSLLESGDAPGAIAAWHRSVAAGPAYTQGLAFLALGYYWRKDFGNARRWADSAVAVDPTYLLARTTQGYVLLEQGDLPRTTSAFEAYRRLASGVELVNADAALALAAARAGRRARARALLARAESLATAYQPMPLHTAVWLAQGYVALGDRDHAIERLREFTPAADLHFQLHLRCDPPFAPLAGDGRFRALLAASPLAPQGC